MSLEGPTKMGEGNPKNKEALTMDPKESRLLEDVPGRKRFKQENPISEKSDILSVSDILPRPEGFLEVSEEELDLERTLLGGQSFRWTKMHRPELGTTVFTGVVLRIVLQLWRVSSSKIAFRTLNRESQTIGPEKIKIMLHDYFQLNYKLEDLYRQWSRADEHLSKCCQQYKGFRILRQDPVENVFSFICATNNNIKRISQMVDKMCKRFGVILQNRDEHSIYDSFNAFPTIERLAQDDVFHCLRHELGFGYRAEYIRGSARSLIERSLIEDLRSPREILMSWRKLPYEETRKSLMMLHGIGRKVADCICLMSMDHLNSVPIDCHIYEIVCKHYMPSLPKERKTVTIKLHDLIGNFFNKLHGPLAGWSTSVLFIAELKHLKQEAEPKKGRANKRLKTKK